MKLATSTRYSPALAIAVLVLAFFVGCVKFPDQINVNVGDGYARKYLAVADQAAAIHISKDRIRQEKLNPDDYKTAVREDKGVYWVFFDLLVPSKVKGYPAHFVVRVAPDGSAEIYKNK
jgi:hypothetical protein